MLNKRTLSTNNYLLVENNQVEILLNYLDLDSKFFHHLYQLIHQEVEHVYYQHYLTMNINDYFNQNKKINRLLEKEEKILNSI